MGSLQVEFSWSKSRHDLFQNCQRAYWYSYYGSWGGWKEDSPARSTYILKNLTNRFGWVGNVVHDSIENVLRLARSYGWDSFNKDNVLSKTVDRMRTDVKNSEEKKYLDDPKKMKGFSEHVYGVFMSPTQWTECEGKVTACLDYFFQSDIFLMIQKSDPTTWIKFEELDYYVINGAKMWVKIDFGLVIDEDLHIFDWKTSKAMMTEEKIIAQLGHYAKYGNLILGFPLNNIKIHEINVNLRQNQSEDISQSVIDSFDTLRDRSCADIFKSFGHDPARSAEELRGVIPDKENFPVAATEQPCQYCNFKKVCDKFQGSMNEN